MDNNTILVIDDDRNILSIIELYLKKAGFNVATCATGYEALSVFRSVKPTLVVLDVMLPGRDGWSILNDIRQESPTPVIMLTAKGDTGERVRGLELGADDYIAKPFDSNELIARIKSNWRCRPRRSSCCTSWLPMLERCSPGSSFWSRSGGSTSLAIPGRWTCT